MYWLVGHRILQIFFVSACIRNHIMVDIDKQACHTLAERGYCNSLWLESYVTWDFLQMYPKAMEPGYLHLN